jgi:hypothetical protein
MQVSISDGAASLYKYVTAATLKRIIQGSVRFTQPSAFNDPFELLPEIVIPEDQVERQLNLSFRLNAARRVQQPGELKEVPTGSLASDSLSRDIVQQLNGLIGILCLSRAADLILMWSHYADQYTGAVIEFDGAHSFFDGQIDVEYRSIRPLRHVSAYESALEPIPIAELCVKSDHWSYEREVRIVRALTSCERHGNDNRGFAVYTQKLPLECIKSIILGERTSVHEQQATYDAVRDTQSPFRSPLSIIAATPSATKSSRLQHRQKTWDLWCRHAPPTSSVISIRR